MSLLSRFRERMAGGRDRAIAQRNAELLNAARTLAADDARFHGRRLPDDEDSGGYKSAIGEGWEDEE
jgi:hypothetical protein